MRIHTKKLTSLLCLTLAACAVGPDYVRPATEKPAAFKEGINWKQAQPQDDVIRSKWWELFADSDLNTLEEKVDINNQNIKAAEAQFRQARALVAQSRSALFPSLAVSASPTRSSGGTGTTTSAGTGNRFVASLDAAWELDIWGGIRRSIESSEAGAQASAADLAAARLSAQSELAIDYLSLRVVDEQKRLLDRAVEDYTKSFQVTENQYKVGVAAKSDVLQAKVQLESTEASAIDIGVVRAQLEHAIAMLTGRAPAEFTLAPTTTIPAVPTIPVSVPSQLLERRPDIAGAERRVAAANAQIGVAKAAFFPDLSLAASGGYQSSSFANWFSLPNRFWSIGPSLVETLFDAGLRSSQSEAAIANYDKTVATYRQTVLGAFQEVEDNLAGLRILSEESGIQEKTVADAHSSAAIALNQYKAGIVSYVNVVTAQTAELNNEIAALNTKKAQLVSAASLIKALGGGWEDAQLNKPEVTRPQTTPLSIFPPAFTPVPNSTPVPAEEKK